MFSKRLFRIMIGIVPLLFALIQCTDDEVSSGSSGKAPAEDVIVPDQPIQKAKKSKPFGGETFFKRSFSYSEKIDKSKLMTQADIAKGKASLVKGADDDLSAGTIDEDKDWEADPIKKELQEVAEPYYNPTVNYAASVAAEEFDACIDTGNDDESRGKWDKWRREYFFDNSPSSNGTFIFAQVSTINQGESDLSRNTFGNVVPRKDFATIPLSDKIAKCKEPTYKFVKKDGSKSFTNFTMVLDGNAATGTVTLPSGVVFTTAGQGPQYRDITLVFSSTTGAEKVIVLSSAGVHEILFHVVDGTSNWASLKALMSSSANSAGTTASEFVTMDHSGAGDTTPPLTGSHKVEGAWVTKPDTPENKYIDFVALSSIASTKFLTDIATCLINHDGNTTVTNYSASAWEAAGKTFEDPSFIAAWGSSLAQFKAKGVPQIFQSDLDRYGIRSAGAIYDSYGRQIAPPRCFLSGKEYKKGETCYVFCTSEAMPVQDVCYHSTDSTDDPAVDETLNNRRRAIMTNDDDQRGLLYMSIKRPLLGPSGNIDTYDYVNVRVQHNLHKSHMFGSISADGKKHIDNIEDDIKRGLHNFSFNIPFCPQYDMKYEYRVCNVPYLKHEKFGTAGVGEEDHVPNCFDVKAIKWNVGDIRVAGDQVPKGIWDTKRFTVGGSNCLLDKKTGACVTDYDWTQAYQLLAKTEFFISSQGGALLADKIDDDAQDVQDDNPPFTELCLENDEMGNKCASGKWEKSMCNTALAPHGIRYINTQKIKFLYTTSDGIEEPSTDMYILLDTNPDPVHWFHGGWVDDVSGRRIGTDRNGKLDSDDNSKYETMGQSAMAKDDLYAKCYTEGKFASPTAVPLASVINSAYSPLVLNINHTEDIPMLPKTTTRKFLGEPWAYGVSFREKKGYTHKEIAGINGVSSAGDANCVVQREVDSEQYVETGWVDGAKGTGLLVLDLNKDGQINSGMELFGVATVLEKPMSFGDKGGELPRKKGDFAPDGFGALLQYDDNGDKVIDSKDAIFSSLQVWVDGLSGTPNLSVEDGELKSMADLGITAINVKTIKEYSNIDPVSLSETRLESTYVYTDSNGKSATNAIYDVYFDYHVPSDATRGLLAPFTPAEQAVCDQQVAAEKQNQDFIDAVGVDSE